MKNLKKVLALGLALVMILGMFTIASAAETKITAQEFTDWADVEHKDAVALAVDLGIISGIKQADGSYAYKPNDTIDRASWAKLVYFTATGDDNADAYLGTATDLKDVKGNWAESFINYIYVNKYVSGDGLGHFMPTGTITVAGGLKTMLTVLGFDADDRGYQNDAAWMGNIMTDAKTNGLMSDIDRKNTAATNLTRDVAAQIIYNALQAKTQTPVWGRDNGEKYVTSYKEGETLGYDVFKVLPVTATVASVRDGKATFSGVSPSYNLGSDVKASANMVGEKVTVWVKVRGTAKELDKVISTTVAKAASSAAKTFTDGVTKIASITAPSSDTSNYDKDYFVAEALKDDQGQSAVKIFQDGVDVTSSAPTDVKAGNICEVYTTKGKVSMIKITTYKVGQVTGKVETRTTSDDVLQVKVPGVFAGWKDADKVDGWQGLAEDDIVLYNEAKEASSIVGWTIEKAEKVTGKVTLLSGAKLTIGGTQYKSSGIEYNITDSDFVNPQAQPSGGAGGDTNWNKWAVKANKDNEYDFYQDKNGTICAYTKVSGETETEVAYVLQVAWVGGNGGIGASKYMEAKLLFTDATTEVVRVDKVDSKKIVASDTTSPESDEIKYSTKTQGNNTEAGAAKVNGNFVDFSVNKDGNYELKAKTAKTGLTAGAVDQKSAFHTGLTGNAKTVFLVKKGDDFSTYTGVKNVPKMTASNIVAVENSDSIATYVYLTTTAFEGEGSDGLIYIRDAAYDEDVNDNRVYKIVTAEGEETTLALKPKTSGTDDIEAGSFYAIDSTDDDGVATVVKKVDSATTTTGNLVIASSNSTSDNAMKAGEGTLTVRNGATSYEYDSETVAVVIDLDKTSTHKYAGAGAISLNGYKEDLAGYDYKVVVVLESATSTNVDFVYVIRTEK